MTLSVSETKDSGIEIHIPSDRSVHYVNVFGNSNLHVKQKPCLLETDKKYCKSKTVKTNERNASRCVLDDPIQVSFKSV